VIQDTQGQSRRPTCRPTCMYVQCTCISVYLVYLGHRLMCSGIWPTLERNSVIDVDTMKNHYDAH